MLCLKPPSAQEGNSAFCNDADHLEMRCAYKKRGRNPEEQEKSAGMGLVDQQGALNAKGLVRCVWRICLVMGEAVQISQEC